MKIVFPSDVQDELVSISSSVLKGRSLGTKFLDQAAITFSLVYGAGLPLEKVQELCGISEATVYRRVKAFADDILLPDGRSLKKKDQKST